MLAEERRQEILKVLHRDGRVHVANLSKTLNVTEETIRRDLEILHKRNLLRRTHGGAIPINSNDNRAELSFYKRRERNVEEKKEIAAKAVQLIKEGDTIFLDASTTSLFLAKKLKTLNIFNLTVLTNSVLVVFELTDNKDISIISTGGILRRNSLSFVGPLAKDTIKKYFADKLFASCKGISPIHGATDSNELEIEVKKNMLQQSKEVIILADHTKFEEIGLTQFAAVEQINQIITDSKVAQTFLDKFKGKGIKIW